MNTSVNPILYVKAGCPWCDEALAFFKGQGVQLETREVRANKTFMDQMVAHSGQSKAPTFVMGDFVVADFDVGEFKSALAKAPAIQSQLGIR